MVAFAFWPGTEEEAEAEAAMKALPPGEARCTCGALAIYVSCWGLTGAARGLYAFEPYCGESSHLVHGPWKAGDAIYFVARDGEWVRPEARA